MGRARALESTDSRDPRSVPPAGAIAADHSELAHNNTYGALPRFYVDQVVICKECGAEELWTAERQKWWYEVAKGNINTVAVLCRGCRAKRKKVKEEARAIHLSGLARKHETKKHNKRLKLTVFPLRVFVFDNTKRLHSKTAA